jgi:hypothetical protein
LPLHDSEEMEALVVDEPFAFQELAQESLWLEHQLVELTLQYAVLDAVSTQLDQREAMLVSDYEVIRMTGNRQSPRLARR